MKSLLYVLLLFAFFSCKEEESSIVPQKSVEPIKKSDFRLSFGSCNKQYQENPFYEKIHNQKPNVWIWGGDNIYSDTEDMQEMWSDYQELLSNPAYQKLKNHVPVMATWDDHDYGLNDGGAEFPKREESQGLFLDFLGVPKDDIRRERKGIFYHQYFNHPKGKIQVIVLDTRYHRTSLTNDPTGKKRYIPNEYGKGTILGEIQWNWLEKRLSDSSVDWNIIVGSIQFLSTQHGYESWGNFPHELDQLKMLIKNAQPTILLSGDRHLSEFSVLEDTVGNHPLLDFTSSGLTHSYLNFKGEDNPLRKGKVVHEPSFGIIDFYFDSAKISCRIQGENETIEQLDLTY